MSNPIVVGRPLTSEDIAGGLFIIDPPNQTLFLGGTGVLMTLGEYREISGREPKNRRPRPTMPNIKLRPVRNSMEPSQ